MLILLLQSFSGKVILLFDTSFVRQLLFLSSDVLCFGLESITSAKFSTPSPDRLPFFYKISSLEKGQTQPVEADSLTRDLLLTNRCYILDCGAEVYVWMGRSTSLDQRKSAGGAAEVKSDPFVYYLFLLICYTFNPFTASDRNLFEALIDQSAI